MTSTQSTPDHAEAEQAPVLLDVTDGVAVVTLNRPDAMNSLDVATKEALLTVLERVAADPGARCVVLRGTGKAFCVGQDLKEHITLLQNGDERLWETVVRHYNPIVELIATMNKPVIAAINGVAAGAGAAFAFAADIRVMAQGAGVNLAFSGIGLSCDSGSSWSLPRLIGIAKAKDLLFFPRTVKSAECLELGMVNQVVPAEELDTVVMDLARTLAAGPTLSYGAMRQAIAYSAGHDLSSSLAKEGEFMQTTGSSADHSGAVDAFIAKERPVFQGR